jgi:hypothetical protein
MYFSCMETSKLTNYPHTFYYQNKDLRLFTDFFKSLNVYLFNIFLLISLCCVYYIYQENP